MQTGNLPPGLPEHSLGWEILAWVAKWLKQPNGVNAGKPFRFTKEQAKFILWLYAVEGPDSETPGKWLYNRAVYRRLKGSGKGPQGASLCLIELLGPARFSHFDEAGNAVARRSDAPLVHIGAVTEQQGIDNTLRYCILMLGGQTVVDGIKVEIGANRILADGGRESKIQVVTNNSAGLEGTPVSFVLIDEPHHLYQTNGGLELAKVCKRNCTKSPNGSARVVYTTNAHAPGRESVAEAEYREMIAAKEGRAPLSKLLYDCLEGTPVSDFSNVEELREAVRVAIGDSVWLDLNRIIEDFYDTAVPIEDSIRFYLNQIAASADMWIDGQSVDLAAVEDGPPARGEMISLGFDGSWNDDASALVGCHIKTGYTFALKVWEKPMGPGNKDWEVPREEVSDLVAWAHEEWDVVCFFSDVHPFESYIDMWAEKYRHDYVVKASQKHAIGFDMRGNLAEFTKGAESFHGALTEKTVNIGAVESRYLEAFKRHLKNAHRRPNQYGVSFAKKSRDSDEKVDTAAAAVIARIARWRAIEQGVLTKRRRKRGSGRIIGFS